MNEALSLDEIGERLDVQLLSQDELISLSGGIGPVGAGILLAGGGVTVFLLAVAVGVAVYYFTH